MYVVKVQGRVIPPLADVVISAFHLTKQDWLTQEQLITDYMFFLLEGKMHLRTRLGNTQRLVGLEPPL